MSSSPRLFFASALACCVLSVVVAQNPPARPPGEVKQQPAPAQAPAAVAAAPGLEPRKQQALEIIEREIGRARDYREARDSARVLTAAAEAVWDYDGALGRKALREAHAQSSKAEAPRRENEKENLRDVRTQQLRNELQAEVLAVAQKRDASLVKEFVEGVREEREKLLAARDEPRLFGSSSVQKANLARLAARLAPEDPAAALDYATQSLGYGIPSELQEVFKLLLKSDPSSARELFRRAVESFIADAAPNIYDSLLLGFYLQVAPPAEVDAAVARRFLEAAYERAARIHQQMVGSGVKPEAGMISALFMSLNRLIPQARTYAPEAADRLTALSMRMLPDASTGDLKAEELGEGGARPLESRDVDDLLSRAGSEKDEESRDALYFMAAFALSEKGEHERSLEVAGRARPTELRDSVFDLLRTSQARALISKDELGEALKTIEKIGDIENRADVTVALAAAARKKKDPVLARSALAGMRKLLDAGKGSDKHARVFLWLASAYVPVDAVEGFELMHAAVKFANSARQLKDIRPEQRHLHLGGYVRTAFQVGDTKADFRSGFRALARQDFERTVQIAELFENELFRGLALTSAADSVLKEKQKRAEAPTN